MQIHTVTLQRNGILVSKLSESRQNQRARDNGEYSRCWGIICFRHAGRAGREQAPWQCRKLVVEDRRCPTQLNIGCMEYAQGKQLCAWRVNIKVGRPC